MAKASTMVPDVFKNQRTLQSQILYLLLASSAKNDTDKMPQYVVHNPYIHVLSYGLECRMNTVEGKSTGR